ncbi:hypothetical protein HS088_TW22G00009 [Tripterygium wilfordii]|uniref:Uncharacterized protein n=1 Tax=Tripterygium wilfordii TaxID=458696 RepID=A0A7J7BWS4_TRIWF|nr:hypothetical protein HS088_TW22G00009 [Tripterygium wilfordii]
MGPRPKYRNFPHFLSYSYAFPHFVVLLLLTLLSFASSTLQSQSPTIYDHLRKNGLPTGLLPEGITEFTLDATTGEFQIKLTQPCNAKFENELPYDFNITGSSSFGKIGNLSGVNQQEMFCGSPSKSFFETAPDCTAVDPGDDGIDSSGSEGSKNQPENLQVDTGKDHTVLVCVACSPVVETFRPDSCQCRRAVTWSIWLYVTGTCLFYFGSLDFLAVFVFGGHTTVMSGFIIVNTCLVLCSGFSLAEVCCVDCGLGLIFVECEISGTSQCKGSPN